MKIFVYNGGKFMIFYQIFIGKK